MNRYAIIPTRNRPHELQRLVTQLVNDHVHVCIIDNGSDPPALDNIDAPDGYVIAVITHEQPPSLYRFWNLGFTLVEEDAREKGYETWDVGVFNDDTYLPNGWWNYVQAHLRGDVRQPALVSGDAYGVRHEPLFRVVPDGILVNRMTPWAFMVRGELGLRADESFKWWWGDTDFEWQAMSRGGVLVAPGFCAQNTLANSTTVGALAEQAGRDRETFARKWGSVPW